MLVAKNLSKNYGNFCALNSLNLSVQSGDIYCLLGANGAGKSTTINLFLDFIKPTSGKALVNNLDANDGSANTKTFISYIPENLMLYPHLSGLENLEYLCGLGKIRKTKEELIQLLSRSGLQEQFINKRVYTYSKGMRQKVGIALARAKEAKVLLLDEPTSGLDPKASNEFSEILLNMKEAGVATLMATHELFRAKEIGTHMGIMKHGELVENFTADELSYQDLEKLYLNHMHN